MFRGVQWGERWGVILKDLDEQSETGNERLAFRRRKVSERRSDLAPPDREQFVGQSLPLPGKREHDPPSIGRIWPPLDQRPLDQAIDSLGRRRHGDAEPVRQFSDRARGMVPKKPECLELGHRRPLKGGMAHQRCDETLSDLRQKTDGLFEEGIGIRRIADATMECLSARGV